MEWFVRRLTPAVAAPFVAMAVGVVATPAIGSADCERNLSFNPATFECKPPPPPPPPWYTPPPPYAPSFAGQDVPPPPPQPRWTSEPPMWSVGFHQWGIYLNGVWVPL